MLDPTKQFHKNAIVVRDDGKRFRLLSIEPIEQQDDQEPNGLVWLIDLEDRLALPKSVLLEQLQERFTVLLPTKPAEPPKSTAAPERAALRSKPSSASLARAELAFKRIEPLVDNPAIFRPPTRRALLDQRSAELGGVSPTTLMSDLRRWWKGGQTRSALQARYELVGKKEEPGTSGRGRPKKAGQKPYQLSATDLENMRAAIVEHYFDQRNKPSLSATLRHLHQTHYTYLDGNGQLTLRPKEECPSYRQLNYFLHENFPLAARLLARKGEKGFAQEDRSKEGSIMIECHGVGHIYEFDATIADVLVVSAHDHATIVGKPTLYLIIDRASRLIVGFYVGLENASYSAAMQAILSIGEDKQALCESLGLTYDPEDWPADGILPEMFLADQGELMHKKARPIARSMRCTLSNVPGLRPDWKPLVECGFKMVHQVIADGTPAYMPDAENRRRRTINRDKEAALTLREFTAVIVSAIIAHNKSAQKGFPLTPAQVTEGVRPIPRELWNYGIRRRMGLLDRMDFERVRSELTPKDKATIQEGGIVYKRLHYSCPEAVARGWFVQGRKKRQPVEIAFDYRLVDSIVVFSPENGSESFVATLTKDSVMFAGMSFAEVQRHFADVEMLRDEGEELTRQAKFAYSQTTKPLVEAAKKRNKVETKGMSRASRRKHTADARQLELAEERQRTALIQPKEQAQQRSASPQTHAGTAVATADEPHAAPSSTAGNVIPLSRTAGSVRPGAAQNDAAADQIQNVAERAPMTLQQRLAAMRRRMGE